MLLTLFDMIEAGKIIASYWESRQNKRTIIGMFFLANKG